MVACLLAAVGVADAQGIAKPHQLIVLLRQRMYIVGETTGRYENYVAAERQAAADMARCVGGIQDFLVEKNAAGQTPLAAAASLGYVEIVGELLKASNVREAIDAVDAKGLSAWDHANLALRQSAWVCNPGVFQEPFAWVPLAVTLPYYLQAAENPYRKSRRLLEAAGAVPHPERAKQLWQDICKQQRETTRANVAASADMLETLLTEANAILEKMMAEERAKKR